MAGNAGNKEGRKPIYRKLRHKYRLVILNDDTFEERFSLILSPLNVFTWGGFLVIGLVMLVAGIIVFTPVREYIPGYTDIKTKKLAAFAVAKADSLETVINQYEQYRKTIDAIVQGTPEQLSQVSEPDPTIPDQNLDFAPSKRDSLLREEIESEERYSLLAGDQGSRVTGLSGVFFFSPISGTITSRFEVERKHYGVDVAAPADEAVKATLDGTVVLATWTPETGHVIQLQHQNDLVSIYKHNAVLLKKMGEKVKAGDAIAIIGNSGSESSGPHLHFELWLKGDPIDPERFMTF